MACRVAWARRRALTLILNFRKDESAMPCKKDQRASDSYTLLAGELLLGRCSGVVAGLAQRLRITGVGIARPQCVKRGCWAVDAVISPRFTHLTSKESLT
jgi:hypothetical protein